MAPEIASAADCATALKSYGTALQRTISNGPREEIRTFHRDLHAALDSPEAHVLITYPPDMPGATAATLLAVWFGVWGGAVHESIGGTVSRVVSGVGHRHDQAWHTDSTPWAVPNRYSILGVVAEAFVGPVPTDIMPVASLESSLLEDQLALSTLRTERIEWRRNFTDLPALQAAILDPAAPRWVWPAIEPEFSELPAHMQRSLVALMAALSVGEYYSPCARQGALLVFDNQRTLHRGPTLEASEGRELVRIKIGGRPLL